MLEQTPKSLLIGTGMTLLGGAMWGMNSTVAKLLMRDYQLDPIWLSCVRALFASLIFLVGSAITTPQKLAGAVKDVKSYPKYLVTTLICVLLVQVSYLMTIDWTNSGTATVLQTLNLIFVLAWVCLRGKRLPLKRELVGVLLAFAGTFLIATGGNFASMSLPWQGLAWGLVDAVSTAAMSILPVVLMLKWGNMTINGITFLMSGLILCPFAQPWANIPALDARGVLLLKRTTKQVKLPHSCPFLQNRTLMVRTSVPASTSARCLAVFGIAGRVSSVQAPTAFTTTSNTR